MQLHLFIDPHGAVVFDFVTSHDEYPSQTLICLQIQTSRGRVSLGNFLHPLQIGQIGDMAEFIGVGRGHEDCFRMLREVHLNGCEGIGWVHGHIPFHSPSEAGASVGQAKGVESRRRLQGIVRSVVFLRTLSYEHGR